MKTSNHALIRLATTNDRNGNPRRCYVALWAQDIVAVWEEGYRGPDAVTVPGYRALAHAAPTFRVTPGEYREILRRGTECEARHLLIGVEF